MQIAGIIAPYQNVSLSSSLVEPTDSVNVIEGDYVHKGQVLAVLDTTDLRASYQRGAHRTRYPTTRAPSRRSIRPSSTSVRATTKCETRKRRCSRRSRRSSSTQLNLTALSERCFSTGYVSQQQVDQQRTTVHNDQQQVRSARASLASADAQRARQRHVSEQGCKRPTSRPRPRQRSRRTRRPRKFKRRSIRRSIVSPVDGVVVNRNLESRSVSRARKRSLRSSSSTRSMRS